MLGCPLLVREQNMDYNEIPYERTTMFDTIIVVLVMLAIFAFPALKAITEPSVNRYLAVQAANRQHMIDNNTNNRPFN